MEISTRSKVSDTGSTERMSQKRKMPSPSQSSNGHSSAETSPCPIKKKKKPGAVGSSKDQSELRHGPFYYVKQPALTTDPVDVVPQDGRNDFYCWLCHREGQVLCCELCPRVYHAKCLKLPAEPDGDWFCPECEKITVAECIETQSKAMMMLTIDQLSYLLKFALQKMKQPGDHPRLSSRSPHAASTQRKTFNWTEPFQKPVSLEQHPDYAEYIFHPMDLCTLEKNIKKKMYGCTEAFLADAKWILHNCIIYNGGNHKLTATAKVIVKICEHEMNEIEVCPECYLSACQKRDNWFCEPCSNPHPLVWAKLKGFPFWPAKALRDKDGQVDARFFGQHDRAWVPLNNCYLMSKEIPFSVKKTKSIFNSAMQEMEVYVENMKKKFGVFNYAPFRTPYTPDNNFQMLLDPSNPSSTPVKTEKQEKIKLSFDMTASPKIPLARTMLSGAGLGGGTVGRRLPLSDMPRSPMSTNSSAHTGSDGEQETADKSQAKAQNSQYSAGEESMDCTASPAHPRLCPAGSSLDSPKPFHSQAPGHPKQEKTPQTGSILNLNLDRSKAEMDLKELSETVQQKQGTTPVLTSPKRQIKSRFQLNLDKTIESCKAQLGIDEISVDVYKGVEHSDSEESDKSDSSDSEYASDDEQKTKEGQDEATNDEAQKDTIKNKVKDLSSTSQDKEGKTDTLLASESAAGDTAPTASDVPAKEKISTDSGKQSPEKSKAPPAVSPPPRDKSQVKDEGKQPVPVEDSDSERELVIDLGEEQRGKDRKRGRKDTTSVKESPASKPEGKALTPSTVPSQNSAALSTPSTVSTQSPMAIPVTMVSFTAPSPTTISLATVSSATASPPSSSSSPSASTAPALKKQRPLLPRETVPVVQRAVVWNPTTKFQTSSQKWHMQKVQRQQQSQQPVATTQAQASSPRQGQAQVVTQTQAGTASTAVSSSSAQQSSQSTRYQTRQAVKAVQQKDTPLSTNTSAVTLVSSSPASVAMMATTSLGTAASSSPVATDLYIPTASADVAADIAKYTNKIMDAIKGSMTEIYNDLSKSTSGNTIAEIRRLRIEIEKLQWLHQQELSEMKHNLELTMAEMRQSLEQERERLVTEVKKQIEQEKQQAVDETKKKQWCANCRKEAIFYCCWNTSYCDYPCQQAHWPEHMKSCTQSATAPQQEPDAESTADPPNKGVGQTSSGPNSLRDMPVSAPSEKDCDVEKSADSVAVSLS
ncbi:protein kinase C-binding protein 1 isoform X4 [Hippoglossus stenolepis]|nr:protein kinase C-binding protein 1 isoform X4 [Hippoglossus stenolepis]XP_035008400.1 protein kinase C-binding protein 1 isoform X4 [Hippoglossus stenolepis]XP_035008401.1 protein kinase C-binding protein 1 isoform X4 [Hippoglossus stenolepis]XP_035008402.1 protein kinase C-binding protein 1 isoform X4 [Hippoglossus stenolepis]XP_035008403.1 protein kinase C-binding protein 1 isoform X4 [Hippoglossus stenolepis]XP_047195365.1 protein kinase C-binding protein 1 isoform X4 [Hippoglossus steno